jgi:hypothetical protein
MLDSIREICDKWNTRPRIRNILLDGIRGWLESPDLEMYQLESALFDDEFQRLIRQQNKIGWKQVFLGRFSWEWCEMQDAYYVTRPNYNKQNSPRGSQWQVAIIGRLWDQWYLVWESRNNDLHGSDAKHNALVERRNTLRTLRELYSLRSHYEPSAQELLMADIRDHEVKSTWHLKTWLNINEPVLRTSYKRAKKMAIAGMKSLLHYWQRS